MKVSCVQLFLVYLHFAESKPRNDEIDVWKEEASEEDTVFNYLTGGSDSDTRYPRVLNFFPVPVEEECSSNDGRRKGTCMNTYECKIKGGKSYGFCALGFGVCCVFTASCEAEVRNNITYFINPHFPDLDTQKLACPLTVHKMDDEIAQLRLEFIHFNLGQPNRKTGECQEDIFLMTAENASTLKICGYNSGQHVYYDVENVNEPIKLTMNLSRKAVSRLWEIRIVQVPFSQRAPSGCLQYYQGKTGIIQTMNFADNGRHLTNQDYEVCIRQEEGVCNIVYEPCHDNAFRISPNNDGASSTDGDVGSGFGGISEGREMDACDDKITLPCDSDDLITMGNQGVGYCKMVHCGSSLCPNGETPCRIESSATPFVIGVHFGPSAKEESPEDNLGMCLTYEQLPCNV
ncbi:unnamed protein product [Callosobruchus maculatus]|uniref:CUB domain-containing protein n=1 Tax=Callosobruchus maculatus TaxID=64391 RepID=A0A653C8N0_CALMS|nr:unnamed protein product [Callosobruchus maculatus]